MPDSQPQPASAASSSRTRLLRPFEHLPLFREDLAPFGDALALSPGGIWCRHLDGEGRETGRELIVGGPSGGHRFTRGGTRALFRTPGPCRSRLALVDGPLQAVCLCALKPHAAGNTSYAAPGGSWSRGADEALRSLLTAHPPRETFLCFAPLADGSCPSRERCLALLADLLPPGSRELVVLEPPPGGWVAALRASRLSALAA